MERILVNEVKKLGGKAYKWISPGNDGVPDRIIFLPGGEVHFVELKSDGGRPRAQQLVQIRKLENLGQSAGVVKGIGGLIRFFRNIGRNETANRLEKTYGRRYL